MKPVKQCLTSIKMNKYAICARLSKSRNAWNFPSGKATKSTLRKKMLLLQKWTLPLRKNSALAEKNSALAKTNSALAQQKAENERLLAEIQKLKEEQKK